MVSGGRQVTFTHYRHKDLWYVTECGFEFPVPIDDIGDATFKHQEKAIHLMRYIRKHMELIKSAKAQPV